MIFNKKALFFHFCITFFPVILLGQFPVWLHNSAVVEANHIVIVDSIVTVGGIFQQELQGKAAQGDSDVFFYQYKDTEELLGKYYLGGQKKEQLSVVTGLPQGGWYAVGSFSDSLFFGEGDTVLYESKNSFFVAKWKNDQQLDWARQLSCTGFMKVLDGVSDTSGALYVTGSFQDTLFLDGLAPLVAACVEAPFVIKIDSRGAILWGVTSPVCQEATGKGLAVDEKGQLYWAGEFRGKLTMDSSFNRAHVVYRDLFLLTLEANTGHQLAQKQFSGVYDNQCTALKYFDNKLYLAGHFRGYLQLDSFLLRTGFKTFGNAYLAELDSTGTTQWATQSSTFSDAQCTDLAVGDFGALVVGYYLDSIYWQKQGVGSIHKSEAFLFTFSLNGFYANVSTGQGKGFDVARGVAGDAHGNPWMVGGFQDSILLGETVGIAQGSSDGFIWRKTPNLLLTRGLPNPPIEIPTIIFPTIELSPQPAVDSCEITVIGGGVFESWQLYNTKGQLVQQGSTPIITTKNLKKKVYSLHVQTSEGTGIEKLLVK